MLKNSLLLLPIPGQVTFSTRVLTPILDDSVSSWIFLKRNIIESFHDYKVRYFSWRVNIQNSCRFKLKQHSLWLIFLHSRLLYSQHAQTSLFIELYWLCWQRYLFINVCGRVWRKKAWLDYGRADHLKPANSITLHNFHSFNPRYS